MKRASSKQITGRRLANSRDCPILPRSASASGSLHGSREPSNVHESFLDDVRDVVEAVRQERAVERGKDKVALRMHSVKRDSASMSETNGSATNSPMLNRPTGAGRGGDRQQRAAQRESEGKVLRMRSSKRDSQEAGGVGVTSGSETRTGDSSTAPATPTTSTAVDTTETTDSSRRRHRSRGSGAGGALPKARSTSSVSGLKEVGDAAAPATDSQRYRHRHRHRKTSGSESTSQSAEAHGSKGLSTSLTLPASRVTAPSLSLLPPILSPGRDDNSKTVSRNDDLVRPVLISPSSAVELPPVTAAASALLPAIASPRPVAATQSAPNSASLLPSISSPRRGAAASSRADREEPRRKVYSKDVHPIRLVTEYSPRFITTPGVSASRVPFKAHRPLSPRRLSLQLRSMSDERNDQDEHVHQDMEKMLMQMMFAKGTLDVSSESLRKHHHHRGVADSDDDSQDEEDNDDDDEDDEGLRLQRMLSLNGLPSDDAERAPDEAREELAKIEQMFLSLSEFDRVLKESRRVNADAQRGADESSSKDADAADTEATTEGGTTERGDGGADAATTDDAKVVVGVVPPLRSASQRVPDYTLSAIETCVLRQEAGVWKKLHIEVLSVAELGEVVRVADQGVLLIQAYRTHVHVPSNPTRQKVEVLNHLLHNFAFPYRVEWATLADRRAFADARRLRRTSTDSSSSESATESEWGDDASKKQASLVLVGPTARTRVDLRTLCIVPTPVELRAARKRANNSERCASAQSSSGELSSEVLYREQDALPVALVARLLDEEGNIRPVSVTDAATLTLASASDGSGSGSDAAPRGARTRVQFKLQRNVEFEYRAK